MIQLALKSRRGNLPIPTKKPVSAVSNFCVLSPHFPHLLLPSSFLWLTNLLTNSRQQDQRNCQPSIKPLKRMHRKVTQKRSHLQAGETGRDREGTLCGLAKLSANMLIVIDQRCWLKRQWAETVLGFGFGFCWAASGNRWHRICVVWVAIKATLCRLSKFLIKYAAECHHYAKRSPWALALTVAPTLAQPLRILFANMQGLPPRHLQFTRQCSRGASRRGSGSEPSMCVWVCVCASLGSWQTANTIAPHLLHTRPSPKSLWHFNRIC